MAATVFQTSGRDSQLSGYRADIVLAETNQLAFAIKVPAAGTLITGKLSKLVVDIPGTTMVVTVYDANETDGNINQLWQYVTADGKVALDLGIPFARGLRVITSAGAMGAAHLVFEF